MPVDQKLDMAIKYGSHKFAKIDQAIELWGNVSELILEREMLLHDIEQFEMTASDPKYLLFYVGGFLPITQMLLDWKKQKIERSC